MTEAFGQTNLTKTILPDSGLSLARRSQSGSFYNVVGRKSALLGYEHRGAEAWVYPTKVLDNLEFSFRVEGYPLEYRGAGILVKTEARPECTIFTYSHAAFTVKQIIFAPVDEAGIVMLFDVDSVLPMQIIAQFKPKMRLMWLAPSATPSIDFDENLRRYYFTEETGKLVGIIGSPAARDVSVMPYQEEPQDIPNRFVIETTPENLKKNYIPVVIAASANGRKEADATYRKLLDSSPDLHAKNVAHYKNVSENFVQVTTPNARLNRAFEWAKIGVDKGVATNPFLGTGLIAGFRASGESERPGFAWFFGRDALWTILATNAYGDFQTSKTALEFLRKFQRADGKIPHEISQTANSTNWFKDYIYAWAAADATPLYIVACHDYFKHSGDKKFLEESWESIIKARNFTAITDTDKNNLVQNTDVGHGWVEGGDLYPPHEEIYQQAVWFAANQALIELADAMDDADAKKSAIETAQKSQQAVEQIFWLKDKNFYAYSTKKITEKPLVAESGANRKMRQERLTELQKSTIYDEDTVLPAVNLWFKMLDAEKSQLQIDRLGSAKIATDWGARILANDSKFYDPLSYHHGSVWGLFTGWQSLAAYNYNRPHVGFQALYANAQLKESNALGYITELLSGDYNAPFGRSSHHQIWSEAMIVTPLVRGLFGVEITDKNLKFAPSFPADWNAAEIKNIAVENARFHFKTQRENGKLTINVTTDGKSKIEKIIVAPAFAANAVIKSVSVNNQPAKFTATKSGDVQRVEAILDKAEKAVIVFDYAEGTEIFYTPAPLEPAQRNEDLKIIRAVADDNNLRLTLEGLGGRTYEIGLRSAFRLNAAENVLISQIKDLFGKITIKFDGASDVFVRREIVLPLQK